MSTFLSSVGHSLSVQLNTLFTYQFIFLALLTTLLLRILYLIYQLFQSRWQGERELSAIPSPQRHWLYGHLHLLKNDEESIAEVTRRASEFSPVSILWFGPFIPRVVVNHPSTVKAILTTTEPKDEFFYGMIKPWLGDGLLISSGQKWFRNRRLLTPGFHFDILRPYVNVYNECIQTMLGKWNVLCQKNGESSCEVEMFEHVSLMTLDSLLKCIFSQESNCQVAKNQNPYIRGVYALSYLIAERSRFVPYHNDVIFHMSRMGYRFRKAVKSVHDYSKRVIQERKVALRKEEVNKTKRFRKYIDFLDILLSAKDEGGQGLSDQEIQDEVDTFMFEGHDTTASGISWILYNLAINPEHQEKCRQEADRILSGKDNKQIEWNDLGSLQYTTLCIKESLRIRPPVPFVARHLTSPLTLPDVGVIPSGNKVMVAIMALHHNSDVWPDPLKFDPLRFLPENTKDRSPYAYVPFSAGPRNCIGQNFAMNEMKVAIATTLHRFELFPVRDKQPDRTNNMVLRSSNGIYLRITQRQK
ncbi:leukotriene-B4 omega-hydroxylase 3-like [Glandiceps talaboti]